MKLLKWELHILYCKPSVFSMIRCRRDKYHKWVIGKMREKVYLEDLKGRDRLGDLDVDEEIILNGYRAVVISLFLTMSHFLQADNVMCH
jgi:hypothetical protein